MRVSTSDAGHQIMPMATRMVRCSCGYAHDSYADTDEEAIKEISTQHPCCDASALTVKMYDCREHQTIGRCRECAR